jgi:teichuronic acid biosynthesis protein TuaE
VREAVVTDGFALVRDSAGLGVGAGNAEPRLRSEGSLAGFSGVENLHNWWLEVLVNLGLVGLALYIALYLTLFRGQMSAWRTATDPFVQWLGLSGALALVGFVIGSLGPSSVIAFAPMWITFGLAMLTLALARKDTT